MESNPKKEKNKRKQKYYTKAGKSSKRDNELASNFLVIKIKECMKGFLITCDKDKEKRCINELFNALNEVNFIFEKIGMR